MISRERVNTGICEGGPLDGIMQRSEFNRIMLDGGEYHLTMDGRWIWISTRAGSGQSSQEQKQEKEA